MSDSHAQRDLALYGRLLREARPYWPHIGAMFVLSMLATPIALLTPLPLKIAVDSVVGTRPVPGFLDAVLPAFATRSTTAILVVATLLFIGVQVISGLQQMTNAVLDAYVGERLQMRFREVLFRHVQRLSMIYHDRKGTADSLYRIQYDAQAIQWIAVYGVTPFLASGVTLAAMIYVTARIDFELALVALTVSPMLFVLTGAFRKRLRSGWHETKILESSALSVVQEVLTGLRVVKAFGQEDREQERFADRAGAGMRARVRLALVEGVFGLLIMVTTAVGTGAVLYIGIRHVNSGKISLGSLLLVMGYLAQLYVPLQTVSKSIAALQSSLASAERVFSILAEPRDVAEQPHALPLGRARGDVEFRDVSFEYESGRPVLRGISFAVESGARVGISGATGAGKTTLVNLLTRFYDPTQGWILLDGRDLRQYRVADLRSQYGIVLQEPVLFSTSIAENIGYARTDAGEHEIVEAARAAGAHDFIAALPAGYETVVGERGMRLSGGERQRVSLARAFLKDAPILILDEPTSSVDVETEALIMEAMERLMRGRTTFMIAHRLSTLAHCDIRLELDHGRLAPTGSPSDIDSGTTAERAAVSARTAREGLRG